MLTITTNAKEVADKIDRLNAEIRLQMPVLWRSVGPKVVENIRARIRTQDEGKWAAMSKWTRAQRNPQRILQDTEQYVKWKMDGNKLLIFGEMPGDWTFTQHHEGFENVMDKQEDGKVVVEITNPGPLGLGSVPDGKFSWVPKHGAGRTPARKIWPTDEETKVIVLPIASRWLEMVVKKVVGN